MLRASSGRFDAAFYLSEAPDVAAAGLDPLDHFLAHGTHWPDRFREICAILDEPVDRRGQLFLVAAGILGKIYAARLKRAGAIVLDIGAIADLWMGKRTRDFPIVSSGIAIEPTT